jgi:hypothetical protein
MVGNCMVLLLLLSTVEFYFFCNKLVYFANVIVYWVFIFLVDLATYSSVFSILISEDASCTIFLILFMRFYLSEPMDKIVILEYSMLFHIFRHECLYDWRYKYDFK